MNVREDILFKLTGDSYGEEQHIDNKAKFIADDMVELFKKLMLEIADAPVCDFASYQRLKAKLEKL